MSCVCFLMAEQTTDFAQGTVCWHGQICLLMNDKQFKGKLLKTCIEVCIWQENYGGKFDRGQTYSRNNKRIKEGKEIPNCVSTSTHRILRRLRKPRPDNDGPVFNSFKCFNIIRCSCSHCCNRKSDNSSLMYNRVADYLPLPLQQLLP